MKYDITYSCGHQGEVDLFGKSRDRERKVKYLETCICPACQTAQIRKEAEDAGLPELEGSEKQIRWALEIRASKIKYTEESIPELVSMIDNKKPALDEVHPLVSRIFYLVNEMKKIGVDIALMCVDDAFDELKNIKSAHWWIDHREDDMAIILAEKVLKMVKETQSITPAATEAQEEEKAHVLHPEDQKSDTIVEIHTDEQKVITKSSYDKLLVSVMREEGLRWNPSRKTWELKIYECESPQDGAAQVGNALLRAGFPVLIRDPEMREKAVAANFTPVQDKWVDRYDDDHLILRFGKKTHDLYNAARTIKGFKLLNRQYILPASSAEEIRDFASMMDFSITGAAEEVMKNYEDSILIVAPETPVSKEGTTQEEKLQQILESDRGVLEDLKEDDL